ncbi:hypoxanthine phosphoribosyltransferase [Sphingobacterium sp. UT-1RO-CII-1]|uniref:hypoxanthine phosphoribosyltransferase n=1 Tax=Sphingobacterium sp. UT-1RO-CII-1 TaxID=2995225 RepID=UPI00227AF007|nr:hypoxanthine phosphoribosyltransferase [Sphingobacterium sp. UT-1RO-CII-1]MCY4781056.1 hypoxanthine phosphoribosyltransferase [Sphingobacterium sp. UT-1RO-CII-1]
MKQVIVGDLTFDLFISANQIKERTTEMGQKISETYGDKKPVFIGVLNGCFMFMADLIREVDIPCELSFVKLSSYQGTAYGQINELLGVGIDLTGRDVILVEDVIDSGNSLKYTIEALEKLKVKSIAVCALLLKPSCLLHTFDNILAVGFEIEKEFVVGYGLDYDGLGRNLADIYQCAPEQ